MSRTDIAAVPPPLRKHVEAEATRQRVTPRQVWEQMIATRLVTRPPETRRSRKRRK